ncbi:MAG: sel1 repeat family protein [Alphaproteobacteria bacterium]|nr:sel1 repeat family protein [Alphaproteobacteria bacterium]
MELLRTAAMRGGPDGMDRLGQMFERGSIIARDYALARDWYERAAAAGSASAAWSLGDMYIDSRGVTRDNFLSYKWFYLCGLLEQKGEKRNEALRAAEDVGLSLSRDQVAEARRQALALRNK